MSIRMKFDPDQGILFALADGIISFDDIQKHLDEETARGRLACPELFDASTATTDLTAEQVRQIGRRVFRMMSKGPFGPTAVITRNDEFYGMARMLGILCALDGGPEIATFRSYDEGMEWLSKGDTGADPMDPANPAETERRGCKG